MDFRELESALRAVSARSRAPHEQVEQHIEQLRLVAQYLEDSEAAPSICNDFHVLADALDDLRLGVTAPFLKPNTAQNRPADPTEVWLARAMVAIAIDVLIEGGMSARAASSAVASKAHLWSYLFGGEDLGEQARRWHALLNKGCAKSDEAQDIFRQRHELVDAERVALGDGATPDAIASAILIYALSQIAAAKGVDEVRLLHKAGFFTRG